MAKSTSHVSEYIALGCGMVMLGFALCVPLGFVAIATLTALFILWLINKTWG